MLKNKIKPFFFKVGLFLYFIYIVLNIIPSLINLFYMVINLQIIDKKIKYEKMKQRTKIYSIYETIEKSN